jgi:UDP-glucose 4-epimerase
VRVAVTGANGFLGRSVASELVERGHVVDGVDLPHHDIRTLASLREADAVIHLAGLLGTHELFDAVPDAIATNVNGTWRVLQAAHRQGMRYVGITMPQAFPSVYTATKIAATGLEHAWHHTYGLPVSRVRAFNAYGPGQKHGPGHPQKIVPTFATEAWAGRPIPVWGDGEQTVDLIHAGDLARMLVDALAHGDDVTFDGGTGTALTVNQVARMVLDITGSTAGVGYLPMRRGETPTRIVATGEGWERLDWKPVFELDQFAETIESYR